MIDEFRNKNVLITGACGTVGRKLVRALLDALKSVHLAGAALYVFGGEFAPGFAGTFSDHPFLEDARNHDNVILTSHIGGSTVDAWRMIEAHTIDMVVLDFAHRTGQSILRVPGRFTRLPLRSESDGPG